MQDDFEAPAAAIERSVTVGDKTAKYRFTEPPAATLETLFDVTDDDGKVSRERSRGVRFKVIATVVSRMDGTPITVEQAGSMRNAVAKALYDAAMDVIGFGKDAEAGND